MTFEIGLVLVLLFGAIGLFATEKISVDLITWLVLLVLILFGVLTPAQAYAGFSNEIIIILASIFVISGALKEAGVLRAVGNLMTKFAHTDSPKFLAMMMAAVGGVSAFMNNTTVTALFTPLISSMAARDRVSPSKLLMPVAFASILGGTCTLIGTSTNVAVSGYIKDVAKLEPLGMFEFTQIGLIILVVGFLYMLFIGQRMLPDHKDPSFTEEYSIREYLSEIIILPNSPLEGQPALNSDLSILNFRVVKVIRNEEQIFPNDLTLLEAGDLVLVTGAVADLIKVKKIEGIEILADFELKDKDFESRGTRIAEILINAQSELAGRTLAELDFRRAYGLTVLGVNRQGKTIHQQLGQIRLHIGDVLLAQGADNRFDALKENVGLALLQDVPHTEQTPVKGFVVLGTFIAAVIVGSLELLPLSVCFLIAALVCVFIGAISSEKAYQFIDWRLLILIGGMTAFGVAFKNTGADAYLANIIVEVCQPLGVQGILLGFLVLTVILTQPMSNAAAALVVLPVALKTAELLHANPRTFAIGVMLAASVSFIAPFEPSCILVYGPGKYKFADFVKVGLGLTVILLVVVIVLLPVFWPLHMEAAAG